MKQRWIGQKYHGIYTIFGVVFASLGTALLIHSHAATPAVSIETEKGKLGGNVSIVHGTGTSGTGVVIFGTGPTSGATSVLAAKYGLTGDASRDANATSAFTTAMADAQASSVRYPKGPNGSPQAVVYVPPGTYRLNGLIFADNIRLEVDANAVLEPVVKPAIPNSHDPTGLFYWGSDDITKATVNVTIIGVGSGTNNLKMRASPLYAGWGIEQDFTVDLEPADSGGTNDLAAGVLTNVNGFLIQNMYVIQNQTIPTCTNADPQCPVVRGSYPPPTTGRAAIVYRPSNKSGLPPGPYFDPTNGKLINMYTIGGPFGYGPTQITSGHNLVFNNLYSEGGTTLRLETDATLNKPYGGEVKGVTANNIVGVNCNRAVALTSHKQQNSDVHISNVRAISCQNGLVEESEDATNSGNFLNSTIDGLVIIGGQTAQIPDAAFTTGLWQIGQSDRLVDVHPAAIDWAANITNFSCSGTFSHVTDAFTLNGVANSRPSCSN